MKKKSKIPFGLKVTGKIKQGNKVYYKLKLKWWYALYTAFFSCFTASWFAEDILTVLKGNDEGENEDVNMETGSCGSLDAD
jgi:hypothetical protein